MKKLVILLLCFSNIACSQKTSFHGTKQEEINKQGKVFSMLEITVQDSAAYEKYRQAVEPVIKKYEKALIEHTQIQKGGIENIYFGLIGACEEESQHYYIINSPTFLIEFDNANGPRAIANNIYAIWREKENEYA